MEPCFWISSLGDSFFVSCNRVFATGSLVFYRVICWQYRVLAPALLFFLYGNSNTVPQDVDLETRSCVCLIKCAIALALFPPIPPLVSKSWTLTKTEDSCNWYFKYLPRLKFKKKISCFLLDLEGLSSALKLWYTIFYQSMPFFNVWWRFCLNHVNGTGLSFFLVLSNQVLMLYFFYFRGLTSLSSPRTSLLVRWSRTDLSLNGWGWRLATQLGKFHRSY